MYRRQRIGIGLYDLDGDGQLHRRHLVHAELDGERTVVAGLTSADAVVLNDQDLSYTRTGFDVRSARTLAAAACQVGDPLSEAVCWNGFWLLVTSGELPAAQFTDMVCRRLQAGGLPEVGIETLLSRAVEAADAWAPPRQRAGLREQIAAATRTAAGDARKLLIGFAASAQAEGPTARRGRTGHDHAPPPRCTPTALADAGDRELFSQPRERMICAQCHCANLPVSAARNQRSGAG